MRALDERTYTVASGGTPRRSDVNAVLYVDGYEALHTVENESEGWTLLEQATATTLPVYLLSDTGSVYGWYDENGEYVEELITTF